MGTRSKEKAKAVMRGFVSTYTCLRALRLEVDSRIFCGREKSWPMYGDTVLLKSPQSWTVLIIGRAIEGRERGLEVGGLKAQEGESLG